MSSIVRKETGRGAGVRSALPPEAKQTPAKAKGATQPLVPHWGPKKAVSQKAVSSAAPQSAAPIPASLQRLAAQLRSPDLTVSRPAARALANDKSPAAVALIRTLLRPDVESEPILDFILRRTPVKMEKPAVKRAAMAALDKRTDPDSAKLLTEILHRAGHAGIFKMGNEWGAKSVRDFPTLAMTMLGDRTDPAAKQLVRNEVVGGGNTWAKAPFVRAHLYQAYFETQFGVPDKAVIEGAKRSPEGLRALSDHLANAGLGENDLEAEINRLLRASMRVVPTQE